VFCQFADVEVYLRHALEDKTVCFVALLVQLVHLLVKLKGLLPLPLQLLHVSALPQQVQRLACAPFGQL
jgi:hypothetical protein